MGLGDTAFELLVSSVEKEGIHLDFNSTACRIDQGNDVGFFEFHHLSRNCRDRFSHLPVHFGLKWLGIPKGEVAPDHLLVLCNKRGHPTADEERRVLVAFQRTNNLIRPSGHIVKEVSADPACAGEVIVWLVCSQSPCYPEPFSPLVIAKAM